MVGREAKSERAPPPAKADHMATRSRREVVTFKHPFQIGGIDQALLPAGRYEVVTDEETVGGPSFASYRQIAMVMIVPAASLGSRMEIYSIGSVDLADARRIDASMPDD
jgi:hypothetical protein